MKAETKKRMRKYIDRGCPWLHCTVCTLLEKRSCGCHQCKQKLKTFKI